MNTIEKISYSKNMEEEWDKFIKSSRNGTFLNSRRFLNYHPPDRFYDSSLMFFKKKKLIGVIPAAIIKENIKKIYFSHPGSTFGGIILGKETKLSSVFEIVNELISYSKENDINEIIIKTSPKIYHTYPSDDVDFSLFKNGFKIKKRDLTTTIFLPHFNTPLGVSMDSRCKRAIRQAKEIGLEIHKDDDICRYWKILKQNLKEKYDTKPTHTLEEIKKLKALFPKKIQLFTAHRDEIMVGGILTFITNTTIHTQYIAMLYEYQKLRPLNAVFNNIIQYASQNGFLYLNFGVSTEKFGEIINWNLFNFKESFGGRGILHDLFYLDLRKR